MMIRSIGCKGLSLVLVVHFWAYSLLLSSAVHAQRAPRFERLGSSDGLSSLAVTALEQDERGFIWVGTFDGLDRYDGQSFTHFPMGDAYLTDNSVQPGALLSHGNSLWIGTRNGLNRLDLATGVVDHYLELPGDSSMLGSGVVNDLAHTGGNVLWIATLRGLFRLDISTNALALIDTETVGGPSITSIEVDGQDGLWMGTAQGLSYGPADTNVFHAIETGTAADTVGITSLYAEEAGYLWIGLLGGGVVRWDPEKGEGTTVRAARPIPGNSNGRSVYAIDKDRQETLWIGVWGEGLCAYRGAPYTWDCATESEADPSSLSSDDVTSLLIDRSGVLFAGTWNGVSKRRSPKAFQVLSPRAEPGEVKISHARVNAIHEDRSGKVWVGYLGGGLDVIDRSAGTVRRFAHESGRPGGLSFDQVWSIAEDRDGDIWVGTGGGGISRYTPRRGLFTWYGPGRDPASLPDALIYSVYEDADGTMWTGTVTRGMARYDAASDGFFHYPYLGGPPRGRLTSLSGRCWKIVQVGSGWAQWAAGCNDWIARGVSSRASPRLRIFRCEPHA